MNALAVGQNNMAIQVLLSCCLVADVLCKCKLTLAITSVNCLTCYDSIGHPTVSLACQPLGVPPSILCMVFQSILMMKVFL